jgi:hypothetical protein
MKSVVEVEAGEVDARDRAVLVVAVDAEPPVAWAVAFPACSESLGEVKRTGDGDQGRSIDSEALGRNDIRVPYSQ